MISFSSLFNWQKSSRSFALTKRVVKNSHLLKNKNSTEHVNITVLCTKKKQFRSEIFSWCTLTNGKTFLRGRLLTKFELIFCSVSDYSKRLAQLVFRCSETRWGKVCFSPSPLLRRNCSVGESPTRFRLLLFRHWHQMWYIPNLSKYSFYKKQRFSCLVHSPSKVSTWCPSFENWSSFDSTLETRWGIWRKRS